MAAKQKRDTEAGESTLSAALSFLEAPKGEVVTELGFAVAVAEQLKARGIYSADDFEREKPDVAAVVRNLLGLALIKKDAIARLCGIAWETVDAIERKHAGSIRDFKARMSGKLAPLLSEGIDQVLQRIRGGECSALDLKLLAETWSLLAGEATVRVEAKEDPAVAAYRALMAEMGSQAGDISALPAPTAPAVHAWPAAPVLEAETLAVDLKSPAENT